MGEALIMNELSRIKLYTSVRVCSRKWLVAYKEHLEKKPTKEEDLDNNILDEQGLDNEDLDNTQADEEESDWASPIPVFTRVRTVTIDTNNILKCSCALMEDCGYPCRHIMHVLHRVVNDWKGIAPTDVSVVFRSDFCHYGYNPDYPDLAMLFHQRRMNDTEGPRLPINVESISDPIITPTGRMKELAEATAAERCLNFSAKTIRCVLPKHNTPASLSQEINMYGAEDSNIDCDIAMSSNIEFLDDLRPAIRKKMMKEYEDFMRHFNKTIIEQHQKDRKDCQKNGTFISSSIGTHRKRKSHGTSHY